MQLVLKYGDHGVRIILPGLGALRWVATEVGNVRPSCGDQLGRLESNTQFSSRVAATYYRSLREQYKMSPD